MAGYPELLRSSIGAAKISRRKLSFQLADKTGNQQSSEYRALGKYLAGDEEPSRERAAVLAVLLEEPKLALVSDAQGRRQGRLGELAKTVDSLQTALDGVLTRLESLEANAQPKRRRANGGR